MIFWLVAIGMTLGVSLWLLWPLLKAQSVDVTVENADLQVYRDQLREVESDLAKGVLSKDEAERTRLEVSRRLLEADKAQSAQSMNRAGRPASIAAAVVTGLVLLTGSAGIYWKIGANGAADFPLAKRQEQMSENRANRPPQSEAEARVGDATDMAEAADDAYKLLVSELREAVAGRPDDVRGFELLAQHEARLGNFAAARLAKGRAIELKGEAATADDFTDYAELMIVAAGGYVSPIAEQALARVIRMDSSHSRARYYSGLDLAQNGRPDLAYKIWAELLEQGPDNAPWIAPIREQIGDIARRAGLTAPNLPGPSNDDIRDAEGMSDAARQDMIRGMVAQLSARLASDGGSASEWARLISAYGVLGETARAAAIWKEAQGVFGSDDIAMKELTKAAQSAGVAE